MQMLPPARDTRLRYPNTETPRDAYLRPIADPISAVDRLSPNRRSRERCACPAVLLLHHLVDNLKRCHGSIMLAGWRELCQLSPASTSTGML